MPADPPVIPDSGTLTICAKGADIFVAASGTGASGVNLGFGLRDGECHPETVPGGRYLVQLQGGESEPSHCRGPLLRSTCEADDAGEPRFSHVQVSSNVRGSFARFNRPVVDVNVANGGTTTVTFVFRHRR